MSAYLTWDDFFADANRRARQAIADKYRDRIEPGVGCDVCPEMCALADLRPLSASEFRQAYRQSILDEYTVGDGLVEFPADRPLGLALALGQYTTPDSVERRTAFWERQRLMCILKHQKSMKNAIYLPLLDPKEHRMVRFEVAFNMSFDLTGASAARHTLYELAEGDDTIARLARSTIRMGNRDGWGDEILP